MAAKPQVKLLTPISAIKGVGPKRAATFAKAGINTLEDLLYCFPLRYEDRRQLRKISTLRPGETVLIEGAIADARIVPTRKRNFQIFAVAVQDGSATIQVVWFNQPWLADKMVVDAHVTLYGPVEFGRDRRTLQLSNPKYEMGESGGVAGIVPVYQRVRDIGAGIVHRIVESIIDRYSIDAESMVPATIRKSLEHMPVDEALLRIHRPPNDIDIDALNEARDPAHQSLIFEEFFMLQAGLAQRTADEEQQKGIRFETTPKMRETLKKMLPFKLTDGQRAAFKNIVDDMTGERPMRRLLQGDVGCGKTIVAVLSAALAIENGYQAALMAPTEILAEQHFRSVQESLSHTKYRVGFLSGSLKPKERNAVRQQIADGELDLIVGTHAMIQEGVTYKRLGLAIIDEQHRFGVLQRARLLDLADGTTPDLLIMTATPIPRSLMLTLFGDLSASAIRDMPPGRQPIITAARTEQSRNKVNTFLESEMKAGRQIYCVAPTIDEGENDELQAATEMFERLKNTFPNRRIGLLHGRIGKDEREKTMRQFVGGKLDMLASTTVIEVGVDVPNATVMLIENAERFGLSQLHQLRGRVGRGKHKSYCILMYQPTKTENARQRLDIMVKTNDGFKIAEKDLELRGPGEFFGTRQSGVPGMRVGHIVRDMEMLQTARSKAFDYILGKGAASTEEKKKYVAQLRKHWERRYGLILIG